MLNTAPHRGQPMATSASGSSSTPATTSCALLSLSRVFSFPFIWPNEKRENDKTILVKLTAVAYSMYKDRSDSSPFMVVESTKQLFKVQQMRTIQASIFLAMRQTKHAMVHVLHEGRGWYPLSVQSKTRTCRVTKVQTFFKRKLFISGTETSCGCKRETVNHVWISEISLQRHTVRCQCH